MGTRRRADRWLYCRQCHARKPPQHFTDRPWHSGRGAKLTSRAIAAELDAMITEGGEDAPAAARLRAAIRQHDAARSQPTPAALRGWAYCSQCHRRREPPHFQAMPWHFPAGPKHTVREIGEEVEAAIREGGQDARRLAPLRAAMREAHRRPRPRTRQYPRSDVVIPVESRRAARNNTGGMREIAHSAPTPPHTSSARVERMAQARPPAPVERFVPDAPAAHVPPSPPLPPTPPLPLSDLPTRGAGWTSAGPWGYTDDGD